MKLFEFECKNVLRSFGIRVPEGRIAGSVAAARDIYGKIGPEVAIKAQVPIGGRMKAGGVRFACDEHEASSAVNDLLGAKIRGFDVERVLIEKKAAPSTRLGTGFAREYYAGITYDQGAKLPVVVVSAEGGIDVEQSSSVASMHWDPRAPLADYRCRELLLPFNLSGGEFVALSGIIRKLSEIFHSLDALLVEVNPLVFTDEGFQALDAHMELDDDALYRHADLAERFGIDASVPRSKSRSALEAMAAEIDQRDHRGVAGRMVEFGGDLGLLIGGGGASLTIFDAIKRHGGSPANYCEIGGNPSVGKIASLAKLILSMPGVKRFAVMMNVVSNTRTDLVARGVVKGVVESGRDPSKTISIFRIPGAWEDEGYKILRKYGVPYRGRETSLDEAARLAVGGIVDCGMRIAE